MNSHRIACQAGFVVMGLLLAGAAPAATRADDHLVVEISRTYAGRTSRPQIFEVWIAADKTYIVDGVVVDILRQDLNIRWKIIPSNKKYLEEPIGAPPPATPPEPARPFRIQNYGFDYQPRYDWSVSLAAEEEIWDGKACRKATLAGDDDCAEETRELWFSRDLPIDIGRYFERLTKPSLDPVLGLLYEKYPELKAGILVKSVTTQERPIGLPFVWTRKLVKAEAAPAPAGIYDLPNGLAKVKSFQELIAR